MSVGKPLYVSRQDRRTPRLVSNEEDKGPENPAEDESQIPHLPLELVQRIVSEFIPIRTILDKHLYLISKRLKILKYAIIHQTVSPGVRRRLWLKNFGQIDIIVDQECEKLGIHPKSSKTAVFKHFADLKLHTRESIAEIDRDVVRTLPSHPNFSKSSEVGQENRTKLRNVLLAVSSAQPDVGYCQGMNFVAATLLIGLEYCPQDAFFMFLSLLRHYHFKNLYSPSVPLLPLRMFHFSKLVRQHVPQVWHHLNAKTFSVEIFANQWIMTLYAYYLDPEVLADKIWTLFFFLGWKFLLQLGVAILAILEPHITSLDVEEISSFMSTSRNSAGSKHPFSKNVQEELLFAFKSFHIKNKQLDRFSKQYISERLFQVISSLESVPSIQDDGTSNLLIEPSRILGFNWIKGPGGIPKFLQVDLSCFATPNRPREIVSNTSLVDIPVRSLAQLRDTVAMVRDNYNREVSKIASDLKEVEKKLNSETKVFNTLIATASKFDEGFRQVSNRKNELTEKLRETVATTSTSGSSIVIPKNLNDLMMAVSKIEREYDEKKEAKKGVYDVLIAQEEKISEITKEKNELIVRISNIATQSEDTQNDIIYRSIQSAIDSFSNR